MGKGSLINNIFSINGVILVAVLAILYMTSYLLRAYTKFSLLDAIHFLIKKIVTKVGKFVSKKEKQYHRDIEIGKLNGKMRSVKTYRFMKDLIIDLKIDSTGITPYELLGFIMIGSLILSVAITYVFFTTKIVIVLMYPICLASTICLLYTRANVAHENRISAIIEAENIICNNIKGGVTLAIKNNIQIIPEEVRVYFRDFVDNIEIKNYHVKTALLELNNQLGTISDDFIKKCIVFELEEEHGMAEMFNDVVELNNIKSDLRTKMKHELEEKVTEIRVSTVMIAVFLAGILFVYPTVRDGYFNTVVGNIIIVLDILMIILIYVISTAVRATEL